jgi:hypothetical protein
MKPRIDKSILIKFAQHICSGWELESAAEKVGLPDQSYDLLQQSSSIIKKMQAISISQSQRGFLASKEETVAVLTDIMRNEQDNIVKLRATNQLLTLYKSLNKQAEKTSVPESDCSVVIHLPSQDPSPTMDSQSK